MPGGKVKLSFCVCSSLILERKPSRQDTCAHTFPRHSIVWMPALVFAVGKPVTLRNQIAPGVSAVSPTTRQSRYVASVAESNPSFVVIPDDGDDNITVRVIPTRLDMGPDPEFIEKCPTCDNTGFVPCTTCDAQGVIKNPRSVNVFYCPDCVGHRKLRCPACGGKCYMCE